MAIKQSQKKLCQAVYELNMWMSNVFQKWQAPNLLGFFPKEICTRCPPLQHVVGTQ